MNNAYDFIVAVRRWLCGRSLPASSALQPVSLIWAACDGIVKVCSCLGWLCCHGSWRSWVVGVWPICEPSASPTAQSKHSKKCIRRSGISASFHLKAHPLVALCSSHRAPPTAFLSRYGHTYPYPDPPMLAAPSFAHTCTHTPWHACAAYADQLHKHPEGCLVRCHCAHLNTIPQGSPRHTRAPYLESPPGIGMHHTLRVPLAFACAHAASAERRPEHREGLPVHCGREPLGLRRGAQQQACGHHRRLPGGAAQQRGGAAEGRGAPGTHTRACDRVQPIKPRLLLP